MSNNSQESSAKYRVTLSNSSISFVKYGTIQFLQKSKVRRILAVIFSACVILSSISIVFGIFPVPISANILVYPLIFAALELINWAVIAGKDFTIVFPTQEAAKERQKAEEKLKVSNEPNNVLNLDVARLNEYYIINQNQAKSSFRWAVFAMLSGFATIVSGIWLFYFRQDVPDSFMASISVGAGCVVNLVSGLFLYLHHKTQERSLQYYAQLARIQNISLAMRLVDEQPDDNTKIESRNKVIDQLLKPSSITDVISPLMTPNNQKNDG